MHGKEWKTIRSMDRVNEEELDWGEVRMYTEGSVTKQNSYYKARKEL